VAVPLPAHNPAPHSQARITSATRIRPQKTSGTHVPAAASGRPIAEPARGINPALAGAAVIGAAGFLAFALFHGSGKNDTASAPHRTDVSVSSKTEKSTSISPTIPEKTPATVRPAPASTGTGTTAAIPRTDTIVATGHATTPEKNVSPTAGTETPETATPSSRPMGFMSGDLGDIREESATRHLAELVASNKEGKISERQLRAEYKKFIASNASTKAGHEAEKLLKSLPPPPTSTVDGPKDGLLGCWSFDGEANDVPDRSGHELDGVLDGATRTADKPPALSFDGNGNTVKIPDAFAGVSENFTISCWAKPNAPRALTGESVDGAAGVNEQRYAVFPTQGGVAYGPGNAGAGLSIGTNGISVCEHSDGYLPSVLVYTEPVSDWVQTVVVYTGNKPTLYVNGVAVKEGVTSPKKVHPSAGLGGTSYGWYRGLLGEVRIYSRALTADEVKALFSLGRR
jgi:hypothetical protein